MKTSILLIALWLTAPDLFAQEPGAAAQAPTAETQPTAEQAPGQDATAVRKKMWTLNDCIRFAHKHNITVQQRALNVEQSNVELATAQFSRLPNLSASVGYNTSFGRAASDDNTYKTQTMQSGSLGVSAGMSIFEGLRINKSIKGGKLNLEAAIQDLDRVREDLSINIMTLYLQVLYNKELVGVAERQLLLSSQQTERSRELVAMGKQPESTLYESEALQASNRVTLTQAHNDLTLALLNLSQALNRESAEGFEIVEPIFDSLSLEGMRRQGSPQTVYDYATEYRPHIRAERLRLESRENDIGIARAAYFPSISLRGGYDTGVYSSMTADFGTQFRMNRGEFVGVSMNIPIFNRMATRNNVRSAKLSMQNQQLALTEAEQALRKEIEQAWYKADAAYGKYQSAEAALASARVAFGYEQQKAEAGRSTIFDFNDAKTRMEKAESDLIQAKFEFVFSSKILDFYKGVPIQL